MAQSAVVTARIDDALIQRMDRLAASYDRSRGWVIARALERYLDEELDLLDSLSAAEADIEAGRVFTQDEVEAMFEVRRHRRDAA